MTNDIDNDKARHRHLSEAVEAMLDEAVVTRPGVGLISRAVGHDAVRRMSPAEVEQVAITGFCCMVQSRRRKAAAAATAVPALGSIDAFRRQEADRAIARIEECYARGLAIPDVR